MSESPKKSESQQQIHRASANPERLNAIIKIIPPPTLLFSVLSLGSVAGLIGWTILGDLPKAVSVPGLFVPPETLSEIKSNTDGYVFFNDDIQPHVSNQLTSYGRDLTSFSTKYTTESNLGNRIDSSYLLNFISFYSSLNDDITSNPSIILNKISNKSTLESSENIKIYSGIPFAYIFDPIAAINLKQAGYSYSYSNRILETQQQLTSDISTASQLIYNKLLRQNVELEELANKGVLPKSDVLSAQQKALDAKQDQNNRQIELQKAVNEVKNNFVALRSGVASSSQDIFVTRPENGYLLAKVVRSGNRVIKGQTVAFTSNLSSISNLKTITIFVPPKAAQGLRPGMKVLVTPTNVDEQQYGSITGKLNNLSSVSIASTSAAGIIGVKSFADETFAKQGSMFMGTVQLDQSNNTSGYLWNTSNGPPYQVAISTPAKVKIIADNIKPISLLIPWFRSFTGVN